MRIGAGSSDVCSSDLLDNLAPSRQGKGGVRRTLGREQVERRLDDLVRRNGAETLNRLRDEARGVAPRIGREAEFEAFERLVGALLGTRDDEMASAPAGARRAAAPFDSARPHLFAPL